MAVAGVPDFPQFQAALRGTPMAREARGIYNAALRGGINPALVLGIAGAESNFGSLGYARGKNNPYGLMGFKFGNYSQATTKLADTLKSRNLGYPQAYGKSGLRGIIGIYTPYGAANGPGNDPASHTRNIINIGRRSGGDPSRVYISGGPGGSPPVQGAVPTVPGVQSPAPKSSNSVDGGRLAALLGRQYALTQAGVYDENAMRQASMEVANVVGQRLRAQSQMATGGAAYGGTPRTTQADAVSTAGGTLPAIPRSARQPKLSKWGGPEDHGSRALGDWQSDMAYDLGGPKGTLVTSPLAGTVVKISGRPGAYKGPQFSGYGVTVDYGGGRQAFFKHLGSKGANIRPGARIAPGTVIGGLDATTGGGPHLHLGASNRGFLSQILSYYTG
jgi:hypothetical protein